MAKRSKKPPSRSGTTQTAAERRANGRPVCSFALETHVAAAIEAIARQRGVSRATVVTEAVMAYFASSEWRRHAP